MNNERKISALLHEKGKQIIKEKIIIKEYFEKQQQ
jgi:hypothetical protein